MLATQMTYTPQMTFFFLYVFNPPSPQPFNHIMSEYYINLKYRIEEATDAIHDGEYKFASTAAQAFEVPVQTLQRRLAETHTSLFERKPHEYVLNTEQREAICIYLTRLNKLSISARLRHLREAANFLLQQANPVNPSRVEQHWPVRFLQQNPQFFKRKQTPLAADRKTSLTVEVTKQHFYDFRDVLIKYAIQPNDIWNMNESDFRIEVERGHLVITLIKKKPLRAIDSKVRDLVSDVKAINAGGEKILPMLIVLEINILNKWMQENDLNDDLLLATTEFEYSNDEKTFDWLKHFDFHSRKAQVEAHRLLIMNNYESHLTYEFLQYVDFHNIVIFTLPSHSTHVTQPLNVGIFQPMKHYHSKVIDETIRLGSTSFNKQNFLAFFTSLRAKAFTESNIRSAFKQTELVSYSPKVVLEKVRAWQPFESTPSRDPFLSSFPIEVTSHEPREIQKLGTELQDNLDDYDIPKKLREKFGRYIKGSLVRASSLALAERDIEATHNHSKAKAKRDKLGESVAQKRGVITVRQARGKITAEVKKKRKKRVRASKREKKRDANARIKWNKAIAKGFKLTDKPAQKWIDKWVTVLDVEYENEASVEEVVDLLG